MNSRIQELIEINHTSVEALRVSQRNEVVSYAYKMRVSDAKRFIADPLGYEIVREFLRSCELTNHHFTSRLEDDVEFIAIGNKSLVVSHSDRSLQLLE